MLHLSAWLLGADDLSGPFVQLVIWLAVTFEVRWRDSHWAVLVVGNGLSCVVDGGRDVGSPPGSISVSTTMLYYETDKMGKW
jgi:hypothetical protein